jgi:hypothetical protein
VSQQWDKCQFFDCQGTTGVRSFFFSIPLTFQKTILRSLAIEVSLSNSSLEETLSLQNLLKSILGKNFTIPLYNDNKSAVKLTSDETSLIKSRHIDIWYHFIQVCSKNGKINMKFLPTVDMVADIFTKGLTHSKHDFCVSELGLVNGT